MSNSNGFKNNQNKHSIVKSDNRVGYQENRAQPLVVNTGLQEDNSIIFSEVNVKTPLSVLITTEKDVDMAIWNSHINAGIKSTNVKYKNLSIENTKMKECRLSLYA